jgi:predicted lipoprotein with Yx(FWY)xxD motif
MLAKLASRLIAVTVFAVCAASTQAAAVGEAGLLSQGDYFHRLSYLFGPHANAGVGTEAYVQVPMPPHFRVVATELDGPVFADAAGHTLYKWPFKQLRVGDSGDPLGRSECTDVKATVNSGFMSPYPPGLQLPDLDRRLSCTQAWPPVLAPADAKPVGKWSLITRDDGRKQWAYEGHALYTSILDRRAGDVLGADSFGDRQPAMRLPLQPPADVPSGFAVSTTRLGRLLQTESKFSVYTSDRDGANNSHCDETCARTWIPMLAPASARPHGDWSVFERSPGVLQWAFHKKPLYRYVLDQEEHSLQGSDVAGWHNVYTQLAPPPPVGFTVQDTSSGQVLADPHGKTVYLYFCADDGVDQLGCDHPSETQAYRLAMCGGGEAERCLRTFPYVLASPGAKSTSRLWSIVSISPMTGAFATSGRAGALRVWAYRDRPVYSYSGDRRPGDFWADGIGEFRGARDGYRAFWLRDDFNRRDE